METQKRGRRQIAVLTDGRAGNEAQARGLAEAIARRLPVQLETCRVDLTGWAAALPPVLLSRLGLTRLGIASGNLPDGPELVIGAGRRVAPLVAKLGQQPGTRSVQLMNPQMPLGDFDAVIAPSHDKLKGPNVLSTVGSLSRLTPATISTAQRAWRSRLPARGRKMAVLIGGPSKSARFGQEEEEALLRALSGIGETHYLMITTSRRTPTSLIESLKVRFGTSHFLWTGSGENPYPAILGFADLILVTSDSVNMASEASSTGKPVYVFELPGLSAKLKNFHESLAAHGASRPFDGIIETWSYPRLIEADRAASWLFDQLEWRNA